jgi:hypothetical protein
MVGRAAVYFQSFFQSKAVSIGDDFGRIDEVLEGSRGQTALRVSEEAWRYSPVADTRDTLSFLRLWIRSLLASIDKFFDEIMNPMNCFPDLEKPVRKGNLFENKPCRCNESQRECDIKDFFLRNQIEFTKILEKLKGLQETEVDNETRQRISALKKIMKKRLRTSTTHFSNKTQDEQMCWACGDAIHAVLAPREARVITRNEKHFRPICEAI